MADKYAPIIYKSLRAQDFNVRNDFTGLFIDNEPGRADAIVSKNGRCCFVEVKSSGDNAFSFKEYRQNQREWAEQYCVNPPYNNPLCLALIFGGDRPHTTLAKGYFPRKLWMIPYHAYLDMERTVLQYQATLPYLAGKGYLEAMQKHHIDALHLLNGFEFPYQDGIYTIPEYHPFSLLFTC